jgi:hypothetical protein
MVRVSREAVVIISSGVPSKRLKYLEQFTEGGPKVRIEYFEIELSKLA